MKPRMLTEEEIQAYKSKVAQSKLELKDFWPVWGLFNYYHENPLQVGTDCKNFREVISEIRNTSKSMTLEDYISLGLSRAPRNPEVVVDNMKLSIRNCIMASYHGVWTLSIIYGLCYTAYSMIK